MTLKTIVVQHLRSLPELSELKEEELVVPPNPEMGDFSYACFAAAKKFGMKPADLAQELSRKIGNSEYIQGARAIGPYLNIVLNKAKLAAMTLRTILREQENYGATPQQQQTILIESPSPNTNKPLHLGHVRNIVLGQALEAMLTFQGHKVKLVDIINDRGVHICKSMIAYQKWGNGKKPDVKGDHFVGQYYVKFAQEENDQLLEEVQDMLRKWELGDEEVWKLWKQMREWCITGIQQTYLKFGLHHAKAYYESEFYLRGKEIVMEGLSNGSFEKDETGAVIADLDDATLGKKVLLRANGTSVYITQDLALTPLRFKDFHFDKCIWVVGNEQIHHFKVLFALFRKMRMPFADGCYHLAYGMVNLPEGKMKSREGTVIDADDLLDELKELAKEEITTRHPDLPQTEVNARAERIGLAGLRFHLLKQDPMKDMTYDPKESLSFEGETGPYVLYAVARINSILKKVEQGDQEQASQLINPEETELLTILGQFPEIMEQSVESTKPSVIAHYAVKLAQRFNTYYHGNPVLKAEPEVREGRLLLLRAVKIVLTNALRLLSIPTLEEM